MNKDKRSSNAKLLGILAIVALGRPRPAAAEAVRSVARQLSGKLLLTGSTTMAPMMVAVGRRFRTLHPGVQIDVESGGSGRGLDDARKGKADIGMVSRALGDEEQDVYGFPIGRDGVAVIVHKSNPVPLLTDTQLRDIYLGKITNWRQVGGRDVAIELISAQAEASTSVLLTEHWKVRYGDIKPKQVLVENEARIDAVAREPRGIVYVSLGVAERRARASTPIKLLPIGGVEATSKSVRSGNYPLSRALTLVTKELPRGVTKEFINFALSSQVTDLIEQFDFVSYLD